MAGRQDGGVVPERREGGQLLAERGARWGWGCTGGLCGVRTFGGRALGALELPEAVRVAGRREREVAARGRGGGAAGGGGAIGIGVGWGDVGMEVPERDRVELRQRGGRCGRWSRNWRGVEERDGVCGRGVGHEVRVGGG